MIWARKEMANNHNTSDNRISLQLSPAVEGLPPSQDTLSTDTLGCFYVFIIWKTATWAAMHILSPCLENREAPFLKSLPLNSEVSAFNSPNLPKALSQCSWAKHWTTTTSLTSTLIQLKYIKHFPPHASVQSTIQLYSQALLTERPLPMWTLRAMAVLDSWVICRPYLQGLDGLVTSSPSGFISTHNWEEVQQESLLRPSEQTW